MFKAYEELKNWREETIDSVADDHFQLNSFHDQLIYQTVRLAEEKVERELGPPPAPFAFFLMGSAGRFEQSVWSDQDHGILFDGPLNDQDYFLRLGEEIRDGLDVVGYQKCEGNVMASNPLWCQPVETFQTQILEWLNTASWQALRNFTIFFDSRVLIGDAFDLSSIKKHVFSNLDNHPELYSRMIENVNFIKKGIGVFGQLLPEYKGDKRGSLNLKQTVYFPYINAVRMLALKKQIQEPSTNRRFEKLLVHYPSLKPYQQDFLRLLEMRLSLRKHAVSYDQVHLITVDQLTKEEKQELKYLIKQGHKLFSKAKSIFKEEGLI
ncbi:DUF294 nucleotidyltransferase-like domain-containing protein [Halobacillus litoralis]|uniref:DUF294 nucleotidyltransferase-like domain-containing protein n=1 Tax=Halobacillus litoralis TaxID=45668 RepID=UPI001CFEF01C|nr:DUF294 nucleotidyltransferase-like domain-containing protein [Halobacillus litoralis]